MNEDRDEQAYALVVGNQGLQISINAKETDLKWQPDSGLLKN